MSFLLFRLHSFEFYEGEGEDAKLRNEPRTRLVGEFPTLEAVKQKIEAEAPAVVTESFPVQGGFVKPLNRFAVYEQTGDTDGDGFPDGFKFLDLYTASQPEPQAPTIRKGKRA